MQNRSQFKSRNPGSPPGRQPAPAAAANSAELTALFGQALALVKKLNVTPEDNDTSKTLNKQAADKRAALARLDGAAFDKAYIDHEVAYHEAVLSTLDKTLIPSAQNAELKALLVKVRPAFVAHLEHAKQIQASLAKSGA